MKARLDELFTPGLLFTDLQITNLVTVETKAPMYHKKCSLFLHTK